jgi:hypothetical protein
MPDRVVNEIKAFPKDGQWRPDFLYEEGPRYVFLSILCTLHFLETWFSRIDKGIGIEKPTRLHLVGHEQ